MPLNFPGKAPSLELGVVSPAFCRSVFALSDLMAQPPGASSPDVQRRAAWAQLFMYVQGLRPSLTEPLTARAKAGLTAILALRGRMQAEAAHAQLNGTPPAIDRPAMIAELNGPVRQDGIQWLKRAFGERDAIGAVTPIPVTADVTALRGPGRTSLECCTRLTEARGATCRGS